MNTTAAAGCPVDFVALPLLTSSSALIGNARWAQATPGWFEPPHLWGCAVGDSGDGKTPGSDCILRDVVPTLEIRMIGDFPERLLEWKAAAEIAKAKHETWQAEVRTAQKGGHAPPNPPSDQPPPEPQAPRLRQNDVTVEKVATLLASAAPKGLLIIRDELAGWLSGMNQYNDAGRAFWVEAYGGRPYRVERQKHPVPIDVRHLVVAVFGSTQPEKLATLLDDPDDGLFSRVIWSWPTPIPFRLGREKPGIDWAIGALDRLRLLEMHLGLNGDFSPVKVPLCGPAVDLMEDFGRDMQKCQHDAGGLMRSAFGKARGLALRLSLVLEMLWWCAESGVAAPPAVISEKAFLAAAALVDGYFMPMAERVYGDAAATPAERNAAVLSRWIVKTKAKEVHVRQVQREARLSGLRAAEDIVEAAEALVEADWLAEPVNVKAKGQRPRNAFPVNPKVH